MRREENFDRLSFSDRLQELESDMQSGQARRAAGMILCTLDRDRNQALGAGQSCLSMAGTKPGQCRSYAD